MSINSNLQLNGLRVLVTAGGGGIGRVIGETFAEQGARVHICDVSRSALDDTASAHSDWGVTQCDVADATQVEQLFADVKQRLGGLDVLVNNAGIAGPTGGVDALGIADWQQTVDINLNGQFYCARLAVPLLKQSSNASIICMSSVAGRLGYAFRTPYAATKWAIIGLVKSLAIELGPDGIRANAILPGIVEGPRMEKVIADRAEATGVPFAEMEQSYIQKISTRKMVTSKDVANQAAYLCSELGASISGQAISVCGNVEYL